MGRTKCTAAASDFVVIDVPTERVSGTLYQGVLSSVYSRKIHISTAYVLQVYLPMFVHVVSGGARIYIMHTSR